jgi:hypothetical protein
MSTCFLPVAADLNVGDEVEAVATLAFSAPRTVARRTQTGDRILIEFTDTTVITAHSTDGVTLTPPF